MKVKSDRTREPTTTNATAQVHLCELDPRILTAYYFSPSEALKTGRRLERRMVADYEIEYILESDGSEEIAGTIYPVRPGDLVFRQPGETTQGIMRYRCYCVILDFHGVKRPNDHYWIDRRKAPQRRFLHPLVERLPPVFHSTNAESFRALFEKILKAFVNPLEAGELIQKALLLELLYRFIQESNSTQMGAQSVASHDGLPSKLQERLRNAQSWIRLNYRKPIKLDGMAESASLSVPYFHKSFSHFFGVSPAEYLYRLRLDTARELLVTTDLSIRAVASESGFETPGYFYHFFKKRTGQTPGDFRQEHRLPMV
jgi:AraC family transcriptional regulator